MRFAQSFLVLATALLLAYSSLLGDPGFGTIRKKKISLPIRQPAAVRLANTSVAFTAASANRSFAPIQDILLTALSTQMLGNEKSLVKKANPADAEWTVRLTITGYSVSGPTQRADTVGKNGAAYVRWTGSLRVSCQVLDRSGHSHDSSNVSYNYDKEFPVAGKFGPASLTKVPLPGRKNREPRTREDVDSILVDEVVRQIAAKLGNTDKTIDVEIAVGEDHLNRAADFLENRLWSRALDELEKTSPFPKPESEAYRQYDLGVVHEAMAYDAKTSKEQRSDLFTAQEHYDNALELNRKEKYFVTTVARVKDALASYKAFENQKSDPKQAPQQELVRQRQTAPSGSAPAKAPDPKPPVVSAKNQAPAPQSAKSGASKPLTAADVVEMFNAGVAESLIVEMIRNSTVRFDPLDKDTAIAIAKAKLPLTLQNELRKKVGAQPLTPAAHK